MNLFPPLQQSKPGMSIRALPLDLAPATVLEALRGDSGGRVDNENTDTRRNHLIVAFSDQMATPQICFFGTIKAATSAGRKYANLYLKRSKHTHRHLVILDESTGKQVVIALTGA